ncbi:hypothetical protein FRB99_001501 [Tulasnella sp. 403]|nr:hypothetical protein FRB99_001501 [Tulasnella sp. 403]
MLHIGLTEPVVFLRHSSDLTASGRRRQVTSETTPSILRGILTLKLNKPTKIKNVEISIIGTSRTHWPEGIGPRRAEILEEHTVLSAKATLFQAGEHSPSAPTRRTKSVGPGVLSGFESDRESDDDDETRGRRRRSNPGTRDTSRSQTPERVPARERGSSVDQWQLGRRRYPMTELPAYAVPSPVYTPEPSLRELPEEDHPSSEHLSPGQTLEDFRNVLRATTDHFVLQPGHTTRRSTSGVRSAASSRPNTSASRSRPPSSLFLHDPNALSPTASRLLVEPRAPDTGSPHRLDDGLVITPISSPIAAADHRLSFTQSTAGPSGRRVSPPETPPLSRAPTREEVPGSQSSKAKQKRFSFGAAWHEMKELVMPSSRRQSMATERPHSPRVAPASPRAPTLVVSPNVFTSKREGSRGRDRTVVGKLSGALGLEEDHKDKKEDWEEFRKGAQTFVAWLPM